MKKLEKCIQTHLRVEDNFQHAVNLNAFNNGRRRLGIIVACHFVTRLSYICIIPRQQSDV
jgi:hypothetical protein